MSTAALWGAYAGHVYIGLTLITQGLALKFAPEVGKWTAGALLAWVIVMSFGYQHGIVERGATLVAMGVFGGIAYYALRRFHHVLPAVFVFIAALVIGLTLTFSGADPYDFKAARNWLFSIAFLAWWVWWLSCLSTSRLLGR